MLEFYRGLGHFCLKYMWRKICAEKICVEKKWQIWGLNKNYAGRNDMKNEFNQDHVVPEGSLHFKESRVHRPCLTKDNCDNNLRQNNDNNNTVFIEGTTRSLKIPLTSKENFNFRGTSFFHVWKIYLHILMKEVLHQICLPRPGLQSHKHNLSVEASTSTTQRQN